MYAPMVTPKIDSVPQLKKYAIEKGVNDEKDYNDINCFEYRYSSDIDGW